jgi:hypothetical protein
VLVLERLGAGYGTDWTDEWIALGLYFALKTSNAPSTSTSTEHEHEQTLTSPPTTQPREDRKKGQPRNSA